EDFVCPNPPEDVPFFITAWIMNQCDEINLDGSLKPQIQIRDSYVHGQKMYPQYFLPSLYLFGHTLGLGSCPWQKSKVSGKMTGNPSISEQVSSYMMIIVFYSIFVLHLTQVNYAHFYQTEIKPFHIYPLPWDEAHLCPVCALGEWMKASKITSGYLF
ncbi:hypothetical protein CPB84DRAFT_1683776, partial [Gymnopilus junonius]